ncbi:four helix bundle protein [Labilibaculum manganireducens]|uniref:four helix bundle protein n=1 Tax=Labilibaculum manganireducens TaxID=1940525 RepID=UPI0029F4709D|nr:four helix bundle protein [Labilibaculum manganireducens]
MVKTHKDLEVWNKAIDFVTAIYSVSSKFPKSELYGLTSQIRRASISIPSNIAEGASRNHKAEFIQFLYISLPSEAEVDTQLIIAGNLTFIEKESQQKLLSELNTISKMLQGLIKSIKK